MITDQQTTVLYLPDSLPVKYPHFFREFQATLRTCGIPFGLLPNTKDIRAVDYMPVQVAENKFVQFTYYPDYLRDTEKGRKTITDVDTICKEFHFAPQKSDILLDGGNVVRSARKVIMCDKVFSENAHYGEKALIKTLEALFEVDKLIFIPTDAYDEIGHAGSMVRFVDEDTVLINQYAEEDEDLGFHLRLALHNARLNYIEVPYNPYENETSLQANGKYLHYLQMQQALIVPAFGIEEDETALKRFEEIFKGQRITTLDSNEIATNGGVLNDISWNILAHSNPPM